MKRFHVDGDMRSLAVSVFQFPFNYGGSLVNHTKRQIAIHTYMSLDGDVVTNATVIYINR